MFLAWTIPSEALARAGRGMSGGGSMGSRGSRTTTPVKPYTPPASPGIQTPYSPGVQPTTPTRPATPLGMPPASPSPTGSFWRNLGGGMVGGFAGGMLANWLFGGSHPAQGGATGTGGGGSSFGLFDLILIAGIGYFLYRFLIKKPQEEAAGAPSAYQSSTAEGAMQPPYYDQQAPPLTEPERDLEKGLGQIKAMDPLFAEDKFKDQAMDFFFKIQGAWGDRDMSTVKHLLTGEMLRVLQEDADKMRKDGLINKIEKIAVREVNLTEAWQEYGQDYITFRVYATLLDYTVDEKTGEIVSGSKTDPVKFEEYWTFTRPLGNNPWQLSAISQTE
jgi:predicted lipid-binding transport protein (Tim44 family)